MSPQVFPPSAPALSRGCRQQVSNVNPASAPRLRHPPGGGGWASDHRLCGSFRLKVPHSQAPNPLPALHTHTEEAPTWDARWDLDPWSSARQLCSGGIFRQTPNRKVEAMSERDAGCHGNETLPSVISPQPAFKVETQHDDRISKYHQTFKKH